VWAFIIRCVSDKTEQRSAAAVDPMMDFGLIERVEEVVVVVVLFLFYLMEVMGLFFFYFLCMERLEVIFGSFDCIAAMDKASHYISFNINKFYSEVMGVWFTSSNVEHLHRRSEGWVRPSMIQTI